MALKGTYRITTDMVWDGIKEHILNKSHVHTREMLDNMLKHDLHDLYLTVKFP